MSSGSWQAAEGDAMNTNLKSQKQLPGTGMGMPLVLRILSTGALVFTIMVLSACTIVLSSEVGGTSSGTGGVMDPMLAIFEEELLAAFDASRSLVSDPSSFSDSAGVAPSRDLGIPPARGLAGGVNSIKHGLPSTTVAQVRARVRETIVAQGLEKSRDLEKVAPAIAAATAEALADTALVGTDVSTADLARVNAISAKALARSLNAPSVTTLAEGLGTESEKQARLDALARAVADNVDTLSLPPADASDSLHMVVLLVTAAGNLDISPSGTGENDPGVVLAARTGSLVRIAGARLDGKLTGTDCSTALNDLANAAVVGLGDTAIRDQADTKLQTVVRDGVLFNLFMAYYGFTKDVGLTSAELRAAINFAEAASAEAVADTGFRDAVNTYVQAEIGDIVPIADTMARTAAIVTTADPPLNELAGATTATSVSSGANTTWARGSAIRVTGNLFIDGNLIIEPGVTVYLDLNCTLNVSTNGSIHAVGTAEEPISFTRALSGNRWGSIEVNSDSTNNRLSYCNISGATNGLTIAVASASRGIAVIDHCVIHDNQSNGIRALYARRDGTRMTTIADSYVYGNLGSQCVVNENVVFDETAPSSFHNPLTESGPDLLEAVNRVEWYGNISQPLTLAGLAVPYYIPGGILVEVNAALELLEGVSMVFGAESYMRINATGSLRATGSESSPVLFTAAQKTPGYWRGLQFHDSSSASNLLDYVIIEYAGSGAALSYASERANLVLTRIDSTTRISISHTIMRNGSAYGLYIDPGLTIDLFQANTCTLNAAGAAFVAANSVRVLGADSQYSGNTIDVVALDETTITTSQSWEDLGVPYRQISLDGRIEVASGANLSLEPGVTIEFAQGALLYVNTTGSLSALGTSENPIVLTGQQKQLGYWRGVDFYNSKAMSNRLSYTIVECAGSSVQGYAAVPAGLSAVEYSSDGVGLSVDHCTFRQNNGYGVFIDSTVELRDFSTNVVSGNVAGAVYAYSGEVDAFSATSTYSGNTVDQFYINATPGLSQPASWPALDVPYRVGPADMVLHVNESLSLAPGSIFRFDSSSGLRINALGSLDAQGTLEAPILLTGSTAQPGYWRGLYFLNTASAANILSHVTIEYAGSAAYAYAAAAAGLSLVEYSSPSGVVVSIDHCTFRNNSGYGIFVDTVVDLRGFSANSLTGNAAGPVYTYADNLGAFTSSSTYSGNTIDRFYLNASVAIAQETTWHSLSVPFLIGPDNTELAVNWPLTIEAGNELIFSYGSGLRINVAGYLRAQGTSTDPILFTGSTAQAGHWKGICFYRSPLAQNAIDYATVEHGGHSAWTYATLGSNIAIVTAGDSSHAAIANSTIQDGTGVGIWVDTEATYNTDIETANTFVALDGGEVYFNP